MLALPIIYTELWRYRQNLFRFHVFFSAQFCNYSCNRRNNGTTYNLFRVTSMIFMIFKDKRPTYESTSLNARMNQDNISA